MNSYKLNNACFRQDMAPKDLKLCSSVSSGSPGSAASAIMADDGEYFSIGSAVSCKTCHGQIIDGEVVAFDYQTKMLILKKPSTIPGKSNVHDVKMVNLNFVEDVVVTQEAVAAAPCSPLLPLNVDKLNGRAKQMIEERQRVIAAVSSGVSRDGVMLFLAITKTINEVSWQGKNIVVMNEVTISPPYRPENCKGKTTPEKEAVNHVRKIVEKHLKDQAASTLQNSLQHGGARTTSATQQ